MIKIALGTLVLVTLVIVMVACVLAETPPPTPTPTSTATPHPVGINRERALSVFQLDDAERLAAIQSLEAQGLDKVVDVVRLGEEVVLSDGRSYIRLLVVGVELTEEGADAAGPLMVPVFWDNCVGVRGSDGEMEVILAARIGPPTEGTGLILERGEDLLLNENLEPTLVESAAAVQVEGLAGNTVDLTNSWYIPREGERVRLSREAVELVLAEAGPEVAAEVGGNMAPEAVGWLNLAYAVELVPDERVKELVVEQVARGGAIGAMEVEREYNAGVFEPYGLRELVDEERSFDMIGWIVEEQELGPSQNEGMVRYVKQTVVVGSRERMEGLAENANVVGLEEAVVKLRGFETENGELGYRGEWQAEEVEVVQRQSGWYLKQGEGWVLMRGSEEMVAGIYEREQWLGPPLPQGRYFSEPVIGPTHYSRYVAGVVGEAEIVDGEYFASLGESFGEVAELVERAVVVEVYYRDAQGLPQNIKIISMVELADGNFARPVDPYSRGEDFAGTLEEMLSFWQSYSGRQTGGILIGWVDLSAPSLAVPSYRPARNFREAVQRAVGDDKTRVFIEGETGFKPPPTPYFVGWRTLLGS